MKLDKSANFVENGSYYHIPKEYEVIKRFYFDGQSQRQIGEALGVAEKTVKNRLYNARNRLRTHPTLKKILKEFNAT